MKQPRPLGLTIARVPDGFPGRADFVKSATQLSEAPHHLLPEVCFCGRSNVGKSSLINSLTNRRQLARVSSTPGRTQLINFFNVQDTVALVDLPGYGWAKVPKKMQAAWGRTVQEYLSDRPQLAMAVLLVDVRREPRQEERDLLTHLQRIVSGQGVRPQGDRNTCPVKALEAEVASLKEGVRSWAVHDHSPPRGDESKVLLR